MNWYPNDNVGTSNLSIKEIGCVLTAYYRIAFALGYNGTIIDANKYAVDNDLFENKRFLSRDDGVKMINGLLKKSGIYRRIEFDHAITGSDSEICEQLKKLDSATTEYFVTIRIKYNSGNGGHHMNIEENAVKTSDDEFIILDTYENWINSSKDSTKRDFTIERIDVFKVYDLNWRMIDNESIEDN